MKTFPVILILVLVWTNLEVQGMVRPLREDNTMLYHYFHRPGQDLFVRGYDEEQSDLKKVQTFGGHIFDLRTIELGIIDPG